MIKLEKILSRKNEYIRFLRSLSSDAVFRTERGEFVCDGMKLLNEALSFNAEVTGILWRETPEAVAVPSYVRQCCASSDVYDFVSPLKNSRGPLFTVKIKSALPISADKSIIVLDSVQDPGNVGTVIRTANAFNIGTVILTGDCADLYNPKTVRATMGAIFRQNVQSMTYEELEAFLTLNNIPLYGAALSAESEDIRAVIGDAVACAIGSEGKGLSETILNICSKKIIIPMNPDSESLNAAVAASVIMWELSRREL